MIVLTPNCTFLGGSTSCAVLSSPGPTSAEIGSHQIIINTTTTVDAGLFGIQTRDDVLDYYYINVSSATSLLINSITLVLN